MSVHLYQHDLPAEVAGQLATADGLAIDTETLGLKLHRERLCLVQISAGDGQAHLVQIAQQPEACPYLCGLLADDKLQKLFHFGRFDLAVLQRDIGPINGPVFCTKIASKLVRTYTDRHGLRDLCSELLKIDISKQQQSSDWAATELSKAQQNYAAGDVLYLHQLRDRLSTMLERENRMAYAMACFDFLKTRVDLDLAGFEELDIFHH